MLIEETKEDRTPEFRTSNDIARPLKSSLRIRFSNEELARINRTDGMVVYVDSNYIN